MARTARKGFAFYRAETDRFDDPKIKRLRKKFGGTGYSVYSYILNEIYRWEGSYMEFSSNEELECSDYWGISEPEVREIVDYCAEIGLFNPQLWQKNGILTGDTIQERYAEMCHAAKRKAVIPEYLNLLNETGEDACVSVPVVPAAAAIPSPVKTTPVPVLPEATVPVGGIVKETLSSLEDADADLDEALSAARLFAPATILPEKSTILPEEPGILPENTPQKKSKEKNTSSSTPSTPVSGVSEVGQEEEKKALEEIKFMGLSKEYIQWVMFLQPFYPELPLFKAIHEIKNSNYRLTAENYLVPLIKNYIQKYNAEIAPQKKQDGYRAALERLGIYSTKRDEILQIAAAMPLALDGALKEIEKSKGKIRIPYCFIMSRLNAAKAA